jgi:hypothetical protein
MINNHAYPFENNYSPMTLIWNGQQEIVRFWSEMKAHEKETVRCD